MFDAKSLQAFFNDQLNRLTTVPEELVPYTVDAKSNTQMHDPWWLAERIVVSLIVDTTLENELVALLQLLHTAVTGDAFVEHVFDIVQQVIDVMSHAFKHVALKNAFNIQNALVTVYYLVVFLVCCALGHHDHQQRQSGENATDNATDAENATDASTGDDNAPTETQASTPPHPVLATLQAHEGSIVKLATMVNKLLLNNEVYEFIDECSHSTVLPKACRLFGGCAGNV